MGLYYLRITAITAMKLWYIFQVTRQGDRNLSMLAHWIMKPSSPIKNVIEGERCSLHGDL